MPTVHVLGTFDGIKTYCFNGKYYEGKFVTHSGRDSFDKMKQIMQDGHAQGQLEDSYTKSILIASELTWSKYLAGTYAATEWGDLGWLHYYHLSDPYDMTCPAWAKTFADYGHLLIHEYADGKVAFMKSEADLWAFFIEVPAPVEHPSDVNPPENQPISAGDLVIDLHITGTITLK